MADDLGLALLVLRTVRGWKQSDLAQAAGVRENSIPQYERGTRVPDPETVRRLVEAMGYRLETVDRARRFIAAVRSGSGPAGGEGSAEPAAVGGATPEPESRGEAGTAVLEREVEKFAAEMEAAVSRLSRVLRELSRRDVGRA